MANGEKSSALSRFFLFSFFTAAFASLIVSLVAPSANASLLSATTTRTALINPSGGSDSGWSSCPADAVVVGFRWSGSTAASAPYSIYCRTLNDDGTIPADQSTASNSTQVAVYNNTSGANVSFCPAGTVATGVRHQGWSNFALICNTPPGLNQTAQYSATVSSPTDRPCAANSILMGMGKWTGAWLDSLYGVCKAYDSVTLTYNVNSGSGTAPTAVTQLAINPFTLSSSYSGTRAGFTFAGWNTLANGTGTSYNAGSSANFVNSVTLYAQWNSVISYDGNGNTGGVVPADTTAIGTAANTTLSTNTGTLVRAGFIFAGWNTTADGSGTSYAAGLTTYTSTGSRTLYAQWNSVITYNGNGNTSGTVPAATTATKTSASTTLATNSGTLAKTGFTFGGWNTAADGSGTSYAAGTANYPANGATTLYAVWNSTANAPDLVASSDTGSSSTDNNTGDQTPEFSGANLTPNATVTIELRNTSTGALVGSCTFVATATTGSCTIAPTGATPVPSGSYYARVVQTLGSSTTTSTSLTSITIDATAPTPQITTTSGTSISLRSTQNGTVTSTELGFLYLVRTSVTVTDEASITGAATDQWRRVTITSGGGNTNQALSALIGGTYRAYAVDQHGNFGGPSTNSMIIYSQASAAQNLVATPGVGSMGPKIDLSWSNPTDTENGGGINFYNVELSTNGGTTWTTFNNKAPITSPFSIYPVNYETDYIFRISGVNLWGVGATSVVSNIANVALPNCSPTLSPNGKTYIFPVGACIWTVPAGVTSLNMDARGGQGGWGVYGYSNGGGQLTGTLTVTAGETLYIFVGDQGMQTGNVLAGYAGRPGFNGGGWGGTTTATDITNSAIIGGGGGGATDIRTTTALSSRIAIAGAAGGSSHGSGNSCCGTIGWGGAGGGTTGGITTTSDGSSGGAGTQSAGGSSFGIPGGALGIGGVGRDTGTGTTTIYGGGGGGGGYYGGGGGNSNGYGQWFTGGGGGSSFATNPRFALGANNQGVNCAPGLLALTVGNDLTQVPGFTRPCSAAADITPPVISTQTLSSDGRTLTLTYTDVNNMSGTYFVPSLFTVTSAGSNVAISSITASGKTLVLTLARNIVPGATTTISYTEPSAGDDFYTVQDTFGNDAVSFTNRSIVTTGITVATPTSVDLATASDSGTSSTDNKTNDDTPTISASSLVIGATVTFSARIGTGTPITCTIVATATTDSCTFSTLPAGVYSVTVTQTSGTTNSTASTALSVDIKTVGPTVTITNNVLTNNGTSTSTSATTFTMTFSASVTGFALADITKTGNNWTIGTLSGSGTTYTITATNSTGASGSEGVLTFSIPSAGAVDEYGNGNVASTTFTNNWVGTVTFNVNSGTGTAPTALTQSTSIAGVTAPSGSALSRTGFTFAGWNTLANGSGITYAVGTSYVPTGNITLFALWKVLIAYDANGGSGSAPSATEVISGSGTVAGANTLTRTGFTFSGWNTQADGQGTSYAVGSTITTALSATLYALWNSTITYDGNTNATGTVPNPTTAVSSNAVTSLAPNSGNLGKPGYTFGGWNTAANGTGTNYPVPTPPIITEVPYMHFFADNFNDTTNAWTNNGDAARSIPGTAVTASTGFIRGNPTLTTNLSGTNGSNKTFRAVKGSTVDGIVLGNQALNSYTFCHVARYAGANRARIFAGVTGNWLSGYWGSAAEVAYHEGWITSSAGPNDTNWRVMCDTGGTPSGSSGLRANGVSKTTVTTNTTGLPANITINLQGSRTAPAEATDWEVAEFYIFDSLLSAEKILHLEALLNQKYGLSAMTSTLDTFNYSSTGNITLYAQWNCAITYAANGATSGTIPAATPCVGSNPVTLRANTGALARTGFNFIGWNTAADGTGTSYSQSANYTPTGDITLYAQWGSTITYNGNGATAGTVPTSNVTTSTAALRLATNTGALVKTNLTFAGWNTKADGTGTSYAAGANYTPTGNITLYALWLSACASTRVVVGGYVIESFTNAGTCYWSIPATATTFDYLIVGGGGGGGSSLGGGGGGGQLIYRTGVTGSDIAVITIGAGGAGGAGSYTANTNHGKKGGNSAFASNSAADIALGGSGGNGRYSATNLNPDGTAISTGYTGGGGAYANPPAEVAIAGIGGAGFIGGNGSGSGGGGGGGAGGPGVARSAASNASSGGVGVSNSITGSAVFYGGGGGAAWYSSKTGWTGVGGLGGGGNGTDFTLGNTAGGAGVANRGGGGGGGYDGLTGGTGGSGIVVVRYEVGRPSAPTITSIAPSAGQLSVVFTPPVSDGGASITNYQYSLDGGLTWVTPNPAVTTSPLVITGLANGTTFPVEIRAFNGLAGVASNEVSATTPLSAPTITAAPGNTDATITVTPGSGATPTSYTVTALDNSGLALAPAKTCTVTHPATSCTISGLTNGTNYKFSAVAIKGALTSSLSNITSAIQPTSYLVTYVYGNGTANTTAQFTRGTAFTLPATPTRSGYTFTGWFSATTGGTLRGAGGASYAPNASETLHAQWSGITYVISYNGNGSTSGSLPANGTFTTGGAAYPIAAVGSLTKSGHTLIGWNTQADGLGDDYGPGSANTSYSGVGDLILYAKWTLTSYTVTYSFNGGSRVGGALTESNKTLGQSFTLPLATGLTNAGFSFGGWSDGIATYRAGDTYVMSPANTTLTAQWIKLNIITFDSNGATSGSAPAPSSYLTNAPGIALPAVGSMVKSGYTFVGWSQTPTGATVDSNAYTTTGDITLYAKWSLATIAPNFSSGLLGATLATITLPTNQSALYGALYTLPDIPSAEKSPSAGSPTQFYAFVGWSDGTTTYRVSDSYRMSSTTPTFTAQWVEVYTVSYSLNGGTSARPADVKYAKNTPITTATAPTREGYTFLNWIDQSGLIVGENSAYTVDDGHYLLYAQWAPINYSITFGDNSGDLTVAGLPATQQGITGQILSLTSSTPSRTGYTFLRWTTNADGTGLRFGPGAQLQLGLANVPLFAQWSAASLTIVYSGTVTSGSLPGQQGAINGSVISLPTNAGTPTTFARAGYTFTGWSDGSALIAPGGSFTMPAVNTLLTAQWSLNAPNTPAAPTVVPGNGSATITVNPGSGNGGAANTYTIEASPGGAFCIVYAPATSCTISPLVNGTNYTFTATATNSSGTSVVSAGSSATPTTKPDSVTGVTATAGEGSASVTFAPPLNDGGAPITSYIVTASPGGQTCTLTSPFTTPLTCNVTPLTNGTAYTFTVTASNGTYTSDPSAASAPVTPITFPGSPTLSATSTTPGSATVTVTPPASNGGSAITSYTVTSSPGGFTCLVISPSTSCSFDGSLTNGVNYTFTATALNGKGSSPISAPTSAVMPKSKPDAPLNVTATPGDEGATISFTAPNANGAAITGYLVTALDANGVPLSPAVTCTPVGTATTCEITTGLTNGVQYKFSVVATNAIGTSGPGVTVATTTPQDRVAPSLVYNAIPTGVTIVNQTLTAEQLFTGIPLPTTTYQWKRCTVDNDPTTCANISGATQSTYQLTGADIGSFIRVAATATNNVLPNLTTLSPATDEVTGIPQTPAITTGLGGNINESYSLATVAFGGATPLLYSITSGTLPTGLTFDPVTGNITGTPTTPATATISVSVVDQKGATSSITFTLTFVDPAAANQNNSTPNQQQNSGAPVTQAAAEKAAAEKAAADAAAKAAAEKAAADAAAKAAADAAAKLAADRAAAEAAARLAAEKRAAAEQAQLVAQAAAQAAAARAAAAESARKSAADAAARAAALSRSNLVSNAAKQSAAAQAAAAEARAAAAVKSAAQAASAASTANANAAAASKEVVITVGALNSAQAAAEKSAALEAQATAARAAAKQAADSAAAQAQAERERAAAATKAAAEALAAAAEKQRLAAAAQAAAQAESERLAKATAERATAKATAEKAATEVASLLSEQAKLSEQLMNAKDPEQIAKTQAALENLNEKLELAQDSLDNAVDEVESAAQLESELTQSVNAAVSRATSATQSAKKANAKASKARTSAQTVVARALVAERAAKSANNAVKQVVAAKPKAPITPQVPTNAQKPDAVISVGGLKPGQKIRVIVKVNVK